MVKHCASNIEVLYSPFRKDRYLPPHLNSVNTYDIYNKATEVLTHNAKTGQFGHHLVKS
jgi:hypothetical protein